MGRVITLASGEAEVQSLGAIKGCFSIVHASVELGTVRRMSEELSLLSVSAVRVLSALGRYRWDITFRNILGPVTRRHFVVRIEY